MHALVKSTPHTPQEGSNQTTLTSLVCTHKKYSANDQHQLQLTDALVTFVAGDLMPLSIVESPRFRSLMSSADPRYQVPSRKLLRVKLLPERSAKMREGILKRLQKASSICVTVDLWSNRQLRSYISITAHFINESEWSLESVMLACSHFKGSHTAEAINEKFQKELISFEILSKVSFIVTDSAANMIKAFSLPCFEELSFVDSEDDEMGDDCDALHPSSSELLYEEIDETCQHVRCFAHTLQLVIKDGFKQVGNISKVLGKASAIVSHVRKSIHAAELLESERSLQTATVTRWNSQLTMIRSILRIPEEKLNSLGTTHELTVYDRKLLEDLVEILTPFETATQYIQGNKVATSSMIVPCIRVLKASMTKLSMKFSNRLVLALKTSVNDRL